MRVDHTTSAFARNGRPATLNCPPVAASRRAVSGRSPVPRPALLENGVRPASMPGTRGVSRDRAPGALTPSRTGTRLIPGGGLLIAAARNPARPAFLSASFPGRSVHALPGHALRPLFSAYFPSGARRPALASPPRLFWGCSSVGQCGTGPCGSVAPAPVAPASRRWSWCGVAPAISRCGVPRAISPRPFPGTPIARARRLALCDSGAPRSPAGGLP